MDLILDLKSILFLRIVYPLLIPFFPIIGTLGSIYLDLIDFRVFRVLNPLQYVYYQKIDKILDLHFSSLALISTFKWADKPARNLAIYAYFYRAIGIVVYFFSPKEIWFLIFPNFFLIFFCFYLLFRLFSRQNLFFSKKSYFVIIALLLIPQFIHEFTHVLTPVDTSWARSVLNQRNPILGISYLVFPLIALRWRLSSHRSKASLPRK